LRRSLNGAALQAGETRQPASTGEKSRPRQQPMIRKAFLLAA